MSRNLTIVLIVVLVILVIGYALYQKRKTAEAQAAIQKDQAMYGGPGQPQGQDYGDIIGQAGDLFGVLGGLWSQRQKKRAEEKAAEAKRQHEIQCIEDIPFDIFEQQACIYSYVPA